MDDSLKIIKLMELEEGDCFEFTTWRQTGQEIWGKPIAKAEGAGEYFMVITRVQIPKIEEILSSSMFGGKLGKQEIVTGFELQIQIQDVGGQFYLEPADRDVILVEQTEFLNKEQQAERQKKRGWRYKTVNDPCTKAEAERLRAIRANIQRGIQDGMKAATKGFAAMGKAATETTHSIKGFGERMKNIQANMPNNLLTSESLPQSMKDKLEDQAKSLPNTAQDTNIDPPA